MSFNTGIEQASRYPIRSHSANPTRNETIKNNIILNNTHSMHGSSQQQNYQQSNMISKFKNNHILEQYLQSNVTKNSANLSNIPVDGGVNSRKQYFQNNLEAPTSSYRVQNINGQGISEKFKIRAADFESNQNQITSLPRAIRGARGLSPNLQLQAGAFERPRNDVDQTITYAGNPRRRQVSPQIAMMQQNYRTDLSQNQITDRMILLFSNE